MGEDKELGGLLNKSNTIYFVFGPIRNNHGIDITVLDGRRLSKGIYDQLDIQKDDNYAHSENSIYRLIKFPRNGGDRVVYAEYRWISPNDSSYNRGAFIAAGCLVSGALDPIDAINAVQKIEMIHEDLAKLRCSHNNSFPTDFQLKDYNPPAFVEPDIQTQLAKLFLRCVDDKGKIFQNDQSISDISVTSEEILRGDLSKYLNTLGKTEEQTSRRDSAPNNQNWLIQFQHFIEVAKENFPQERIFLSKLVELEKERERIIETLDRNLQIKHKNSPVRPPNTPRRTQRGYSTGSFNINISSIIRGFSWRTFTIFAIAILICITTATAVFVIWRGFLIN